MIQDPAFNADGSLAYPAVGVNPEVHPQWVQDFFGDVICVNGKAWPFLHGGAAALSLPPAECLQFTPPGPESRFRAAYLADRLRWRLAPPGGGTRPVYCWRRRSEPTSSSTSPSWAGATITLRNQAKTPFVDGEPPDPQTTGQVLQFRVGKQRRSPDHSLPRPGHSLAGRG